MARKTLQEVAQTIGTIRTSDVQRGVSLGFHCFDNDEMARTPTLSIRKGYPIFVAALPHSGKSEFVFELLLNLSHYHGWKHCIYSGEEGDAAEVYVQLIEKRVGKQFRMYHAKGMLSTYAMSEAERTEAEMWVNEHFYVIDDSDDYTPEQFCNEVSSWERELGFTFDTMTFDPFNDFTRELQKYYGKLDQWLSDQLKLWRRECKTHNRAGFLINHIQQIPLEKDKDTGKRYPPLPAPTEWAMGQEWFRRGFLMITLWRPPDFMKHDNGRPYEKNELIVAIQKAKPKGVASLCKVSLFWNWQRKRYQEREGNMYYFVGELQSQRAALRTQNTMARYMDDYDNPDF
jgi:hypothetical protein